MDREPFIKCSHLLLLPPHPQPSIAYLVAEANVGPEDVARVTITVMAMLEGRTTTARVEDGEVARVEGMVILARVLLAKVVLRVEDKVLTMVVDRVKVRVEDMMLAKVSGRIETVNMTVDKVSIRIETARLVAMKVISKAFKAAVRVAVATNICFTGDN